MADTMLPRHRDTTVASGHASTAEKSVSISRPKPMEPLSAALQRTSVAAVVKRAREQSYVRRLTKEQEKVTKKLSAKSES